MVDLKSLAGKVWEDIQCTRATSVAAGLAYYFLFSLFPLLLVAATLLGFLPIPNLFGRGVHLMSQFIPQDAMGMVRETLRGMLSPHRTGLLSFGVVTAIWSASGGFSSLIDALDIAYDAKKSRGYLMNRLIAFALTFIVGGLFTIALIATVLGPEFGHFLTRHAHLSAAWTFVWPVVRWAIMLVSVVLAVELLYFIAPNVKQKFWATLPGALLAVMVWVGASYGLGIYFSHFSSYNKTYGTLGAVMALMLWLWITSLIIIVGAELNAELIKAEGLRLKGQAKLDEDPQNAKQMPPAAA